MAETHLTHHPAAPPRTSWSVPAERTIGASRRAEQRDGEHRAGARLRPRHGRLVLCDAEVASLRAAALVLRQTGWQVAETRDGESAWEALRHQPVHCLLTDCTMPGLSGLQLIRRLRSSRFLAATPVILLTARSLELNPAELDELLIGDVIAKPFSPRELAERVHRASSATADAPQRLRRWDAAQTLRKLELKQDSRPPLATKLTSPR